MAERYPNRQFSKRRELTLTNASTTTAVRVTSIFALLSSATVTSNVVTVTTSANHNLATGDRVVVAFGTFTFADGSYVITRTGATTFTFVATRLVNNSFLGSDITDLYASIPVISALFSGEKTWRTANTGDVYVGGPDGNLPIVIQPQGYYQMDANPSLYYDLADFYFKPVTADDGLVVQFD